MEDYKNLKKTKFLINFDEIVKPSGLFIIRTIRDNYAKSFSNFINIKELNTTSDEELEYLYISRNIINPLEWLKISEFDYVKNYDYFYNKYKNMYINTKPFPIMEAITNFINAYFITNVYFYSEKYDKRIDFEVASIKNIHSKKDYKIAYVTGNLNNVIDELSPEVIFYPYLEKIYDSTIKKYPNIIFSIPSFGYNFNNTIIIEEIQKSINNIGFYPVIRLTEPVYFG